MSVERIVMAVAGTFVLLSAMLGYFYNPMWLWFTAFVGANLLQSSITGFCPLASILKWAGVKSGTAFE